MFDWIATDYIFTESKPASTQENSAISRKFEKKTFQDKPVYVLAILQSLAILP